MSFGAHLRRTMLMLVAGIGAALLAAAAGYGLLRLFFVVDSMERPGIWGLLYALLMLAAFLVALVAGGMMIGLFEKITSGNMVGKLLPAFALSGIPLWLGTVLCGDPAFVAGLPEFLMKLMEPVQTQMSMMGAFMFVFGGGWIFTTFVSAMRLSKPEALLRGVLIVLLTLTVMAVATYYAMEGDRDFPGPFLGWVGAVLCGCITVTCMPMLVYLIAYSVGGRMKGLFWILYLLSGILLLVGLWQVIDLMFIRTRLAVDALYLLNPDLAYRFKWLVYDASGLLFAVGVVLCGGCLLFSILSVHGERCPSCGRYAYRTSETVSGARKTFVSGAYDKINTTTDTHVFRENHTVISYVDRETEHYQDVTYVDKVNVSCRYCGRHYGQETVSGTYARKTGSDRESWTDVDYI